MPMQCGYGVVQLHSCSSLLPPKMIRLTIFFKDIINEIRNFGYNRNTHTVYIFLSFSYKEGARYFTSIQPNNLCTLILFSLESDQLLLPWNSKAMPIPCACVHRDRQNVAHIRQSSAAIASCCYPTGASIFLLLRAYVIHTRSTNIIN